MLGYEAISSTGRSSFQAERIERIVSSFLPLCRLHVNFTRSIETGILFIYLYVFTYLRETSVINQIFPIHYIRDCKKRNSSKRLTRTSTFVSSSWKWTKCACVCVGEINVCRNSDDSPVTLTFASPVMEEQSSSYVPFLRPLNERNFFKRERICLSKDSFSKFSPLSKRGRANDFSSTLSPFFSTYIYNNAVTFFSSAISVIIFRIISQLTSFTKKKKGIRREQERTTGSP